MKIVSKKPQQRFVLVRFKDRNTTAPSLAKYFPRKQRGLTLVELMLGLVLASFLALGIMEVLVGNLRSAKVSRDIGYTTEGGGFGMLLLKRYIQLAGYENYFQIMDNGNDQVSNKIMTCNPVGTGGERCSADNQSGGAFDTLVIEYDPPNRADDEAFVTCGGATVDGAANSNLVRVRERFHVDTASSTLRCTTYRVSDNSLLGGPRDLIPGVIAFQVQYGLATDSNDLDQQQYVNVPNNGNQQAQFNRQLRSIKLSLALRSNEDEQATTGQTGTLQLGNMPNLTGAVSASSRVYNTTIAVNNGNRARVIQ